MQQYDLPIEELKRYKPNLTRAEDFRDFWTSTQAAALGHESNVLLREVAYPSNGVNVYELSYLGFGNNVVKGWYAVPKSDAPHPGLAVFHGYNWSYEGQIHEIVNLALHGYATFGMQTRGQQGSEDNLISPHGHHAGWMTKGILDKESYYYLGIYMDAVLAMEVLAQRPEVDSSRIGVTGASQGGGITLAVAALSKIPRVAVAGYPYLCHFRRAVDVAQSMPYLEINQFFRRNMDPMVEETAMKTLSYFDVMNLAPWITCPVLVSIGLIDDITPPSTVFAAFNHLKCPKEICYYRYFGHEYIPAFETERLSTLKRYLQDCTVPQ
ncbi:acetylxylan esterase [Alicyclobacillus ferrooxydans]|uniref:Cephalosporin deacetylase n=1 Tax=Alicyclobacillus ferrooxydans TaxID=471514 RepID=A0A0P9C703_9BACL|nr:acetylxylan esterase [Alicyclobacillus ferrooxydans]KPV40921.1 cephalosporin deacetylase [Alicyclobacillus ferrooxydans]